MKNISSLIVSLLACFILIGRVPFIWIKLIFVYIPFVGIIIGVLMNHFLPEEYFSDDKTTVQRTTNSNAPLRVTRYLNYGQLLFVPMLIGFSIAYFFLGGWTK